LAALALTFVFVLVPVATVLCEASCAQHGAMSAMTGGHRCCHGAPPGHAPAVLAVAPLCDHPADTPPGTNGPQQVAGTAALPTFAVSLFAPVLHGARVRTRLTSPVPLTTTTPLRI
jgi:hypothetical protein